MANNVQFIADFFKEREIMKLHYLFFIAIVISCAKDPKVESDDILDSSRANVRSNLNNQYHYPDFVIHNANIITMDENASIQEAIAIKGTQIIAVGFNKEILKLAKPRKVRDNKPKIVNAKGLTIMPGIVDAHTHLFNSLDPIDGQQIALENGMTTLGNLHITQDDIRTLRTMEQKGILKVKLSLYLRKNGNCGDLFDDWYLDFPPTRNFGEKLRIGGVKIFADGGSCLGPAVSVERIPGQGLGKLFFDSQEKLNEVVVNANDAGYQVAIHAIGDRGIEQALNAIEKALDGGPNTLRHRIEHNGVLRPDLIPRYGELDVVATIFGYKRTCWLPDPIPVFYQESENAYRTLIQSNPNLHVAWHGDDPAVEPVNPFVEMFSLVTRIDVISPGGPCAPPDWLAKQALPVKTVLHLMTMGAAYALDRESEVGSLEPGKFADLIAISADPLATDPNDIKDIKVLMTMINGQVVHVSNEPRQDIRWRLDSAFD
ncbi:amidohydrolase [Ulvibacterium marinum]|uniref:amidohydrolase n=1 Tax=Ulvibacterium marinum TaxID=2419782 RepID=UPI002494388A|nr:amidohydrolase family protein [Ulvibacterium marinum]